MKKTIAKYLLLIIIVAALVAAFSACSVEQAVEYNDSIDSKVGDSYNILETYAAPDIAVEYTSLERVTKQIIIDNRISGLHVTGLYIPKGETVTITIDRAEINNGHEISLNANFGSGLAIPYHETLTKEVTTIKRLSSGALIEFRNNNDLNNAGSFVVTISGALECSYYRYGLDNPLDTINQRGNYISLDATNIRIYVPTTYVENILSVEKTMNWWRNAMIFMDNLLDLSFYAGDYSPLKIYAINGDYDYDVEENCIMLGLDYVDSLVSYTNLSSGNYAETLDILKKIATEKIAKSSKYNSIAIKDYMANTIASITYANMTDSCLGADIEQNYLLSSSKCIQKAIDQTYVSEEDKITSLFMNLYYGFGEGVVFNILNYCADDTTLDKMLEKASELTNSDLGYLAEQYEIVLSSEQIEIMNSLENKFYLVGNAYTMGQFMFDSQTGYHVKIGETTTIDFNNGMVHSDDSNWVVDGLQGSDGSWSTKEQGVYNYTPSSDLLDDTFTLYLKNGEQEISLLGKITVDAAVCSYSVYNSVDFDNLKDAKKGYKDLTPTLSKSLTVAEVVMEDDSEDDTYSFAVTQGCIEVPETGNYTLYLTSSGLCMVLFGVKEYNSTIFENSLTVGSYTDELSYTSKLQYGYTYYFSIYVLSNKGSGFAKLGIKNKDGDIEDVGTSYLIHSGLNREEIIEYIPDQKQIDAIYKQEQVYESSRLGTIADKNGNEYELKNRISGITGEYSIDVPLLAKSDVTYIKLEIEDMADVGLKVYYGNESQKELISSTLQNGVNLFETKSTFVDSLKFVFEKGTEYSIKINSIEIGKIIQSMPIVPSTSTTIEYIGEWKTVHNYVGINGSLAVSSSATSEISYRFNGDEISVYSTLAPEFGSATIYIDGTEIESIDLYNSMIKCSQLVFHTKLDDGDHTIEIRANGETPINLDYFAVSMLGETKINNDFSKIWYVIFIPIIVIAGAVTCFILDRNEKKKKELNKI